MGGDFFSNFWKGGDFENEFGKPCYRSSILNSIPILLIQEGYFLKILIKNFEAL